MNIFGKIKKSIKDPQQLLAEVNGETFLETFFYHVALVLLSLVILVVGAIVILLVSFVFSAFAGGFALILPIALLGLFYVLGWKILVLYALVFLLLPLLTPLFTGLLYFIIVSLYKEKRGYLPNYRAIVYATTPYVLLGFIPIVNIIVILVSLSLLVKNISLVNNLPTSKAGGSLLLAICIWVLISLPINILIGSQFKLSAENFLALPTESGKCYDSDGRDFYTKGKTIYGTAENEDGCYTGSLEGYVQEWQCKEKVEFAEVPVFGEGYKCPNGCLDGACIK